MLTAFRYRPAHRQWQHDRNCYRHHPDWLCFSYHDQRLHHWFVCLSRFVRYQLCLSHRFLSGCYHRRCCSRPDP